MIILRSLVYKNDYSDVHCVRITEDPENILEEFEKLF